MAAGGPQEEDVSIGRPIPLVDYDDNGELQFNEEKLEKLLMSPENQNEPMVVVSIAGLKRKGKSFMLNILMRYFSVNCSETWMEDKETELRGFDWRGGSLPVTTGLWIWNQVFTVEKEGKKVHVILIDNEGSKSLSSDVNNDAALFALGLLSSSIQIYNIKEELDEGDFKCLDQAVETARKLGGEEMTFPNLVFLIRDWPHDGKKRKIGQFPYGESGGNDYLQGKFRNANFDKVHCFLLPSPGEKIRTGKSKGCIKDADEEFLEYLNKFLQLMFKEILSSKKKIQCGDLYHFLKTYVGTAKEKQLFSRSQEMSAIIQCTKKFQEKLQVFDDELRRLEGENLENFDKILDELQNKTLEQFKKECKQFMFKDDMQVVLEENVQTKIQDFFVNVVAKQQSNNHKLAMEGKMNLDRDEMLEEAAKSINDSAHDESLVFYRNEMSEKDRREWSEAHTDKTAKAVAMYKWKAIHSGESYSRNLEDLERAITKLYEKMQTKAKTTKYVVRWFGSHLLGKKKSACVRIPDDLLKNEMCKKLNRKKGTTKESGY